MGIVPTLYFPSQFPQAPKTHGKPVIVDSFPDYAKRLISPPAIRYEQMEGEDMVQTTRALRIACIRLVLALMGLSTLVHAQSDTGGATADKQQSVGLVKESIAKNQAALQQYTWTETTKISLKGEVKKQEQNQCQYGPDGKVQKTPLQDAAGSQPPQQDSGGGGRRGGAMKKQIVEKKVDELKDYMQQAQALMKEYVPPDRQKIQAAQAAGNISVQPSSSDGTAGLTIKNYEKQGDSVALGFDTAAKKIRSYNVNSYLDNPKDDPVTLAVTFVSLPDGTNYAQQTVLNAPAKKIEVTTTNSDYKKLSQ